MTSVLRGAHPDELSHFSDWAAAEGWNPGLDDMAAFHATDPDGFFVAEIEGEPVAAISVVNHSDAHAFLGFYLCRPAYRGAGIGYALWQHALDHAGARTVGLDGVADQEANYRKSGFQRAGASVRYAGALTGQPDPRVRAVEAGDFDTVRALDRAATGVERDAFLAQWKTDTETRRTLMLADETGFATIRRCREGTKIGPVIAPSAEAAMTLCRAAVAAVPSDHTFIDLPDTSQDLITRLTGEGFVDTFATARMYRGPAPAASALQQAIATMELG
ncbi:MAG: GNAT family N-acetyltransferase [Pseudomonadota bacterium]|nr:GNAT family N-acetyltransferase [Pseudomonadota bacterium]